jgi:hypothetical protein
LRVSAITLAGLSLLLAACTATPVPEASCQVTARADGLGKTCKIADDCFGLPMSWCPTYATNNRVTFCSATCLFDADCGAGAACIVRGVGARMCVPKGCESKYAIPREVVEVDLACDVSAVNAYGVGLHCKTHNDCDGKKLIAHECPVSWAPPSVVPWCTMFCDVDADCGTGAFCWWNVKDGFQSDGLCVPTACRKSAKP